MTDEQHFRKLERMYHGAPINSYYEPALTVSERMAEIVLPVHERHFHAAGAVHGAVSFALYLVRPISSGELLARGRVTHRSRRLFLADAELHDRRQRLIARGSGSFMPSSIPLDASMGYE